MCAACMHVCRRVHLLRPSLSAPSAMCMCRAANVAVRCCAALISCAAVPPQGLPRRCGAMHDLRQPPPVAVCRLQVGLQGCQQPGGLPLAKMKVPNGRPLETICLLCNLASGQPCAWAAIDHPMTRLGRLRQHPSALARPLGQLAGWFCPPAPATRPGPLIRPLSASWRLPTPCAVHSQDVPGLRPWVPAVRPCEPADVHRMQAQPCAGPGYWPGGISSRWAAGWSVELWALCSSAAGR